MEDKELKKHIELAKKSAKSLLNKSNNFIIFSDDSVCGWGDITNISAIFVIGLLQIMDKDVMSRTVVEKLVNLAFSEYDKRDKKNNKEDKEN